MIADTLRALDRLGAGWAPPLDTRDNHGPDDFRRFSDRAPSHGTTRTLLMAKWLMSEISKRVAAIVLCICLGFAPSVYASIDTTPREAAVYLKARGVVNGPITPVKIGPILTTFGVSRMIRVNCYVIYQVYPTGFSYGELTTRGSKYYDAITLSSDEHNGTLFRAVDTYCVLHPETFSAMLHTLHNLPEIDPGLWDPPENPDQYPLIERLSSYEMETGLEPKVMAWERKDIMTTLPTGASGVMARIRGEFLTAPDRWGR